MKHLILNLESPLMAFGGETIDNLGVIRRFPSASMLTGLLANALGWRRVERQRHQDLQDRLVFAARIDREPAGGGRLTDFQMAQLGAADRGWTTRGRPEGRAGGANTYLAPHLRYRDYHADMKVTVALRLKPTEDGSQPDLEELAERLEEPARPLFLGRKPCLPSAPLLDSVKGPWAEGDTALAALRSRPLSDKNAASHQTRRGGRITGVALLWPDGEGDRETSPSHTYMITDERNWATSGLHGGGRLVHEAYLDPDRFGPVGHQEVTREAQE